MSILLLLTAYSLVNFISLLPSEKVRITRQVRSQAAKNIKEKLGLIPIGIGAQMMDQIEILMLGFQCKNDISMEEGRKLLVYSVIEFLKEINSNEAIRKYLYNYPFLPQNVEVTIFLAKPDGSSFNLNDLEVLSASDGMISFNFCNGTISGYNTYRESFKDALRIVEKEIPNHSFMETK